MRNRCAALLIIIALLPTGCATRGTHVEVQQGCRMYPSGGYIDSRITALRLEQNGVGCRFEAIASSSAAARSQTSLLVALATLRCGEVMVIDETEPVADSGTETQPVQMRLTLNPLVPSTRCALSAESAPEKSVKDKDARIYSTQLTPPRYPAAAYREGRQGEAILILLMDNQARMLGAVLEKSSGHADLDEVAVAAANNWTFGARGEQPEISSLRLPVNFALE